MRGTTISRAILFCVLLAVYYYLAALSMMDEGVFRGALVFLVGWIIILMSMENYGFKWVGKAVK